MPAAPHLAIGTATHVGRVRDENQDALAVAPPDTFDVRYPGGILALVADGMGGHRGGREASHLLAAHVADAALAEPQRAPAERLREAVEEANALVHERAGSDPSLYGMGTTCTALLFHGARATLAHVGDSRAYRIADGALEQLSDDHSRVGEMVRDGLLTRQQAERHPQRNVLTRAAGVEPTVEVDVRGDLRLTPGQRYLLCSDGLTGPVSDDELFDLAGSGDVQTACDRLVELALERGAPDNVTVVLVEVQASSGDGRLPRPGSLTLLVAFFVALLAYVLAFA